MELNNVIKLFDESILLEKNIATLYQIFSKINPTDTDFWGELYLEEKSHALLLQAAKDSLIKRNHFPENLITDSIENLKNDNIKITTLIDQYKQTPPNRIEAFEVAIKLEGTTGEIHYQMFMNMLTDSRIEAVFQNLNKEDKDHLQRIQNYFNKHL